MGAAMLHIPQIAPSVRSKQRTGYNDRSVYCSLAPQACRNEGFRNKANSAIKIVLINQFEVFDVSVA